MLIKKQKNILIIIVFAVSYYFACTPQKTHKTLTFFFDGVPELVQQNKITDSTAIDSSIIASTDNKLIDRSMVHPPYFEKKCAKCHYESSRGGTKIKQPELCYQCHDDFSDQFATLHGPVAGGYCTSCHNPHRSEEKMLLRKSGSELCFKCHEEGLVYSNKFHTNIKDYNCTECHNPHGGENRYVLRQGVCYKCHEDFGKKYAYLHGPVNGNFCIACHTPHASEKENLIAEEESKLCLSCHGPNFMTKNKYHQDEAIKCTECHNPHGGNNKLFTYIN